MFEVMYQTVKSSGTLPKSYNTVKVTPGPYKATKLWNQIVCTFREGMPQKRHRRRLKVYHNCFTVKEAVDYLQELLKLNHNIGSETTRMQTIQLLEKFLCFRVIEDVSRKLKSEQLQDDNRLFRFAKLEDYTFSKPFHNKSLEQMNDDIIAEENAKFPKYKTVKELRSKARKVIYASRKRSELPLHSQSDFSFDSEQQGSSVPACVEVKRELSDAEVNETWRNLLVSRLQIILHVERLDDMLPSHLVNAEWVKYNSNNVGKSGVVQVSTEEDLPQWTLMAMTWLANWPNGINSGPSCYPGFENDVLQLICQHYCNTGVSSVTAVEQANDPSSTSTKNYSLGLLPDSFVEEPLLTYDLYELFTNIIDLINPDETEKAIESLQLCLLLLPPRNRRKLHLLLRMLAKMSVNPHLEKMGHPLTTRTFLLQMFSRHILSCCEEVPLDELLAIRLVTFMLDNYLKVMEVPEAYIRNVEETLARMRKPFMRYNENNKNGSIVTSSKVTAFRTKKYRKNTNLRRSKSFDAMKSVAGGWRQSTSKDDNDDFTSRNVPTPDISEPLRRERNAISGIFETKKKPKQKSEKLKKAESVQDVSPNREASFTEAVLTETTKENPSSKGMWTLMRRIKKRNRS